MTYTAACALGVAGALLLDLFLLRTRLVSRRAFWTAYAICLLFQLIVNGVLTGRGLVTYSPHAIDGTRLAYAPVEDLAFGFSLVLQTLSWWVWWGRRARQARSIAGTATAARRPVPTRTRRSSTP
jgi:lycopene cyclase domain-containing protein